ncbi:MAG: putative ABC transporter permease [Bacilli bacterium]|nr:putative ABC transporter permease [Bacilli bacterium]
MAHNFAVLFLYFFLYSVVGYVCEVGFCTLVNKKFTYSRGFLIGPYLPIYGTGAVIVSTFLQKYSGDVVTLFVMSTVYCSILEYLTSYVMEKIFHLRWWDYSKKKFQLNGRVCLTNAILFGIGGVFIIEVFNPLITTFIYSMSPLALKLLFTFCFFVFTTDLFVTLRVMVGVKVNLGKMERKDSTTEIREEIHKFLHNYSFSTSRLFQAFPNMQEFNGKAYERFVSDIQKIRELRKKRR